MKNESSCPLPEGAKVVSLYSSLGEWDSDEITADYLNSLGFEHDLENGISIGKRELELVCSDTGATMFNNAWARFIRVYIIDGKKYLNLSDDDTMDFSDPNPDMETNCAQAIEAFEKAAKVMGGFFMQDCARNDSGVLMEYWIDAYIPIEAFDGIQTEAQMKAFLSKCDFSSVESAKELIAVLTAQ